MGIAFAPQIYGIASCTDRRHRRAFQHRVVLHYDQKSRLRNTVKKLVKKDTFYLPLAILDINRLWMTSLMGSRNIFFPHVLCLCATPLVMTDLAPETYVHLQYFSGAFDLRKARRNATAEPFRYTIDYEAQAWEGEVQCAMNHHGSSIPFPFIPLLNRRLPFFSMIDSSLTNLHIQGKITGQDCSARPTAIPKWSPGQVDLVINP